MAFDSHHEEEEHYNEKRTKDLQRQQKAGSDLGPNSFASVTGRLSLRSDLCIPLGP